MIQKETKKCLKGQEGDVKLNIASYHRLSHCIITKNLIISNSDFVHLKEI